MSKQRGRNLTATDPDYSSRDFYNSIMEGNFPSWILKFQVMTFQEAETYEYNPFYGGRVWPEDRFPNIEIGKIVLNELPKNYFADVEQLAFSPGHLVPGIEPSPDRMLQVIIRKVMFKCTICLLHWITSWGKIHSSIQMNEISIPAIIRRPISHTRCSFYFVRLLVRSCIKKSIFSKRV
ncbi:Catalase [Blattella germanica]|nr:Catalase [Blattella germanica]